MGGAMRVGGWWRGGLIPAAGSPRQGRLISVSGRAHVNTNGARPFCDEEGGDRDAGATLTQFPGANERQVVETWMLFFYV